MALPQLSKLSEFLAGDTQQSGNSKRLLGLLHFSTIGQKDNRPRICTVFLCKSSHTGQADVYYLASSMALNGTQKRIEMTQFRWQDASACWWSHRFSTRRAFRPGAISVPGVGHNAAGIFTSDQMFDALRPWGQPPPRRSRDRRIGPQLEIAPSGGAG
jgi:hypothetical protein